MDADTPSSFVFNARYVSTWTPDRVYRVYFRDGHFYFIRIGGQYHNSDAVAMQFGLVGALIALWLKSRRKQQPPPANLDAREPEELLTDHKHNFKFHADDVLQCLLQPAAAFPGHGPHVGRCTLHLREGKKLYLEMELLDDMHCVVENLPKVLTSFVDVKLSWDAARNRYTKTPT